MSELAFWNPGHTATADRPPAATLMRHLLSHCRPLLRNLWALCRLFARDLRTLFRAAFRSGRAAAAAFFHCDADPPPAWYIGVVLALTAAAFFTGCLLGELL